jgi:hypothetical protein
MKITLTLMTLLLISSCERESQISISSSKITTAESSLSKEQAKATEIKAINGKLNSDPQYQLTKNEYQALMTSGLLSESEKEELGNLFK